MHRYGMERCHSDFAPSRKLHMRIENDRHIVTLYTSSDGESWNKFDVQMETSGYHHNVAYDFLSFRPAVYASGGGGARYRNLRYRAL